MNKKILISIFLFIVLFYNLCGYEFGIIAGTINKPSSFNYGLSGGMGFIVPMLKFEVELYKKSGTDYDALTGGVKFRPKLGKISPYAILGIGTEFKKFDFHSNNYDGFTFFGGGVHIHLVGPASFRVDFRYLNFSFVNRVRLTGGIFINL